MILSKPNYIKIYGHRGARGDMPENSLSGFKYIFDNNFFAFETDVLISKDKIPLIAHDFYLNPYFTKDQNGEWIKNKKIKEKEFKLLPNSGILSAPVYKGGEQPDLSKREIIKLNSNEKDQ